ncbi:hypothetical protein TB2_006223 [Malus domestica]
MVDGFCHTEDFEGGLKVLTAMLASRHCPRLDTFECLVTGLLKCGQINDACLYWRRWKREICNFIWKLGKL